MSHSSRVVGRVHKKGSVFFFPRTVAVAPNTVTGSIQTRNLMQDDHIDRSHGVSVHFLTPLFLRERKGKKRKRKGQIYGGT